MPKIFSANFLSCLLEMHEVFRLLRLRFFQVRQWRPCLDFVYKAVIFGQLDCVVALGIRCNHISVFVRQVRYSFIWQIDDVHAEERAHERGQEALNLNDL